MRRTATRFSLAATLIVAAAWPGVAFAAGASITGTVTFAGTAPKLNSIPMDADPVCAKKHSTPVQSELLVLGSGNTMGNVLVWVSKGLPAGKTYPAPSTPVTLDQNGCMYVPHVQGIMVGQTYHILNSDGVLHNIHALPKINAQFNKPMPPTMKDTSTKFDKAEDVFTIKCDVHPWMQAYMGVFSHPFFATTKADGKFTISGLDPGTYTITAWHERLGTQTTTVTVPANGSATANFTYKMPGAAK